jgi:ankyrin repeat protein
MTTLHSAASTGDFARVRSIVSRGEDINAQMGDFCTPLHRAVKSQHENIVRFLICHGANCNIANREGRTPLHLAAEHDNVLILLLLLEGHAELNPKDVDFSFKKSIWHF